MCDDNKPTGMSDCIRPLYWTGMAALVVVIIIAAVFFSKLSEMQRQIDSLQGQMMAMQQIAANQALSCAIPSYKPQQE